MRAAVTKRRISRLLHYSDQEERYGDQFLKRPLWQGDFFIADAATGGNILAYAALDASKTIDAGDLPRFNANALTITLD